MSEIFGTLFESDGKKYWCLASDNVDVFQYLAVLTGGDTVNGEIYKTIQDLSSGYASNRWVDDIKTTPGR